MSDRTKDQQLSADSGATRTRGKDSSQNSPSGVAESSPGVPLSSKPMSSRPQKSASVGHYTYLMDLARWSGIHWEISSMHATVENAIEVAANQKDEIERLRAALEHLRLYVAVNGDDWVQRTAGEYLAGAVPPASLSSAECRELNRPAHETTEGLICEQAHEDDAEHTHIADGWEPIGGVAFCKYTDRWQNKRKGYQKSETRAVWAQAVIRRTVAVPGDDHGR